MIKIIGIKILFAFFIMNDPIKILHKYKNNQKRIQYNINIYIGPVEEPIMNILNVIKDLSLHDTLLSLDINDINLLTNKYGEYWYTYFFILAHIQQTLRILNKKIITNKFGDDWYDKHVSNNLIIQKQMTYNFSSIFKPMKIDKRLYTEDGEIQNYYYTYGQHGGNDVDDSEIEQMYEETSATETSALIIDALGDKNIINNQIANISNFDESFDDDAHDVLLKNLYRKIYVTTQYIFKDDNIKTIKNKILCGQTNHHKFGDKAYILPSRQYLWSEYIHNDKKEQITIGHKWLKRNEILQIDIEPNTNISVYEDLRGNLATLKENFKKYGSRIRMENNDSTILNEYDGYYSNNEIFMIDIYNELGKNYKPEQDILKNIFDVYIHLYFPKIRFDEFKNIIEMLNTNENNVLEKNIISDTFNSINNDLILENEVTFLVENTKEKKNYKKYIGESYITHSFIYLKLSNKFDLYKIFDDFITDEDFPFIQYNDTFKYNDNVIGNNSIIDRDILYRWFSTTVHGISFKLKTVEESGTKYMVINLNENGRLDYKTQWKEEDNANIDNITKTFEYIRTLLKKIDIKINLPKDNEFKFAFINTTQKFQLEDNLINHNDLSEFARFFYPYISLVIDPRKRKSKTKLLESKSKYGTYLRFKRETGYENQTKIEQRILYFMRNYEMNEKKMAVELGKQFNITEEKAMDHILKLTEKYTSIRKSRKILKVFDQVSHVKPPGVNIDIQGKQIDKYKIRISGTKNREQLNRIIDFMNVFLFLYNNVYLEKDADMQYLKEKLKKLTNIARRRNKVSDIYEVKEIKVIKKMTKLDKKRLGFTPEKGQNHWTRSCQNSGPNKKRQPLQYNSVDELLERGYEYNKETGLYEKTLKKGVVIRAVKLPELDETGFPTGNELYYACDQTNNTHIHIDFLSKSSNPNGLCMPCCFIKDPYISKNLQKKNYFLKCINEQYSETTNKKGDILYILQDTNKIQDGRLGFMPVFLDKYFNEFFGNKIKMSQRLLIETSPSYFFKVGNTNVNSSFIYALGLIFDIDINTIRNLMISSIEKDNENILFTALNGGTIREMFRDRDKYIDYLKYNIFFNHVNVMHLISLPGVITQHGFNIVIFNKVESKNENTNNIVDDFVILCHSYNDDDLTNSFRDTIFLLKDNKSYYPIVRVTKNNKNMEIDKQFNNKEKIISYVQDYYKTSCLYEKLIIVKNNLDNITPNNVIKKIKYKTVSQIIDSHYKCIYLIIDNNIIPVKPSGTLLAPISDDINTFIKTFDETINYLNLFKSIIPTKPIGIYINKNNEVVGIMTETKSFVPIKNIEYDENKFKNYIIEDKPLYNIVDEKISEKVHNNIDIIDDDRIIEILKKNYINEGYELFRLEFSEIFKNNKKYIDELKKLLVSPNKNTIKKLINEIISKYMHIGPMPDISNYKINNLRQTCDKINDCSEKHCVDINNVCKFTMTENAANIYVNKIVNELIYSEYKKNELFGIDDYFVSKIVNKNNYTMRPNQKIIKSTNNFHKIIEQVIGKETKKKDMTSQLIQKNYMEYPLVKIKDIYVQKIIDDNLSLFRAFSNCIYWNTHPHYNVEMRNLGYYGETQTVMSNYLKSMVIEWLLNKHNNTEPIKELINNMPHYQKFTIEDFAIKLSAVNSIRTNCIVEMNILSTAFNFNIIVYGNNNEHMYIFNNSKCIFNKFDNKNNKPVNVQDLKNYILLRFNFSQNQLIPTSIDSIYL